MDKNSMVIGLFQTANHIRSVTTMSSCRCGNFGISFTLEKEVTKSNEHEYFNKEEKSLLGDQITFSFGASLSGIKFNIPIFEEKKPCGRYVMYICAMCDTICCLVNPQVNGFYINSQLSLTEEIIAHPDYSSLFHVVLSFPSIITPLEPCIQTMSYQMMVQKYLMDEKVKMEKKIQEIADSYRKEFAIKFQKVHWEKDVLFNKIEAHVKQIKQQEVIEDTPLPDKIPNTFPNIVEKTLVSSPLVVKKISDPKTPDMSPPVIQVGSPLKRPTSMDSPSRVILTKSRGREKLQDTSQTYTQAPVFLFEDQDGVVQQLEEDPTPLQDEEDEEQELGASRGHTESKVSTKPDFMLSCSVPVRIPLRPRQKQDETRQEEEFWQEPQFSYIEKYQDVRDKFQSKTEAK